jgi:hypothetical protein
METKHHDGTPREAPASPPEIIGRVLSVSDTDLPRAGFWLKTLGPLGSAIMITAVIGLKASARASIHDQPVPWLLVAAPVLVTSVFVIGFVLLWITSSGPITTWVGDRGVVIAKRRWLGHKAEFRFADLATVELLTTHAYDRRDRNAAEPRYRALIFKLIVRTRTGNTMSIAGEAPYREPGRYDDAADQSRETFQHLGHHHRYWLARAIESAYRAAAGGST